MSGSFVLRCVALAFICFSTVHAETIYLVQPHAGITAYDSTKGSFSPDPNSALKGGGITFNITYLDNGSGFDDPTLGAARKAALQDVLLYLDGILNETGTIDIEAKVSQLDGAGFLATAGTFFSSAQAFQRGSTLERIRTGAKPFVGFPEISLTVDFGFDYHLGSPETIPFDKPDLRSNLIHELTHGIGYLGLSNSTGGSGIAPGVYSKLDELIIRNSDSLNLFSGAPPAFAGQVANLTSNALSFEGVNANALYAEAARPGIYSPSPYRPGSSLGHWNLGGIVGGAVMEPALLTGTILREYKPVDLGAVIDIGWVNAGEGPPDLHTADQDGNSLINLSELLRVIQFFNLDGYSCAIPPESTEDGYEAGPGDESCALHDSDYSPADFVINLSELLRLIQFFNLDGYFACPGEGTEDGFCPGQP